MTVCIGYLKSKIHGQVRVNNNNKNEKVVIKTVASVRRK